jgi:hypothetical protein
MQSDMAGIAQIGDTNPAELHSGQVHRAKLEGKEVVVKVQRPGLKALFDIDLKNLRVGPFSYHGVMDFFTICVTIGILHSCVGSQNHLKHLLNVPINIDEYICTN